MRVEIQSPQDNLMRDCGANNVIIYSLIFQFSTSALHWIEFELFAQFQ